MRRYWSWTNLRHSSAAFSKEARSPTKNRGYLRLQFFSLRTHALQRVLSNRTMKYAILTILISVGTLVNAQTQTNLETLNRLWQVVQQIDAQNMERVSEEKLGVKIELPVESTRPPSPVLMQSLSGSTTWLFSKRDLEALQTNISAIRYERHHYYSNNRMQYQLGIGLDKAKSCISTSDVREFLSKNKYLNVAHVIFWTKDCS